MLRQKTVKTPRRLSEVQVTVLIAASSKTLARSSMGWAYDDGSNGKVISHAPTTIKSLWKLGLLEGKFDNARVLGSAAQLRGLRNPDGTLIGSSSTPRFEVWTSRNGVQALHKNCALPKATSASIH